MVLGRCAHRRKDSYRFFSIGSESERGAVRVAIESIGNSVEWRGTAGSSVSDRFVAGNYRHSEALLRSQPLAHTVSFNAGGN